LNNKKVFVVTRQVVKHYRVFFLLVM